MIKIHDIVEYKGNAGRVISINKDGTAWVSALNMPFYGSNLDGFYPLEDLIKPPSKTAIW